MKSPRHSEKKVTRACAQDTCPGRASKSELAEALQKIGDQGLRSGRASNSELAETLRKLSGQAAFKGSLEK